MARYRIVKQKSGSFRLDRWCAAGFWADITTASSSQELRDLVRQWHPKK